MLDVMFYEAFEEEERCLKELLPDTVKACWTWKTIQEENEAKPKARLICTRTQSQIPISWANQVQGVLSRSTGYDHLVAFYQQAGKKIPCASLGNYCQRAVAEQAILAMFTLLRKLKKQMVQFATFERDHLTGLECYQKNMLVIGVGNIGSEIVDIGLGLKMNVKGVDLVERLPNLEYVALKDGIAWADIVMCALPLTPDTHAMLNYDLFKTAKANPIFINISRGEISPVKDLQRLLQERILAGLSLDVFEDEKQLANSLRNKGGIANENKDIILNLSHQENVVFTPHNAFNTIEALERKSSLTVTLIDHFFKEGAFPKAFSIVK